MGAQAERRYSIDEYLAIERSEEARHEFIDGEIFAMGGASRRHNLLNGNLFAALHSQLRGRGCEIYANDMRLRIPAADLFTYPDVAVVCDEPLFDDDALDTLLNPTLIIEVLSQSTEDYDRGRNFAYHRTLDSLREYLLFGQDRAAVEHYRHREWLLSEVRNPSAPLELPSIGCRLPLDEVYGSVFDL